MASVEVPKSFDNPEASVDPGLAENVLIEEYKIPKFAPHPVDEAGEDQQIILGEN